MSKRVALERGTLAFAPVGFGGGADPALGEADGTCTPVSEDQRSELTHRLGDAVEAQVSRCDPPMTLVRGWLVGVACGHIPATAQALRASRPSGDRDRAECAGGCGRAASRGGHGCFSTGGRVGGLLVEPDGQLRAGGVWRLTRRVLAAARDVGFHRVGCVGESLRRDDQSEFELSDDAGSASSPTAAATPPPPTPTIPTAPRPPKPAASPHPSATPANTPTPKPDSNTSKPATTTLRRERFSAEIQLRH
jgi:hypothetical protein